MELRSTRSRSKTPFTLVESFSKEALERDNHVETTTTVVKTTRKSTTGTKVSVTESAAKPVKKSTSSRSTKQKIYKTSDYSSEDDTREYDESFAHRTISENEKNQILEDARALANGSGDISALEFYKKSGRYWDKYPKTDYTYSYHSKDRFEIAPGEVIMPNMSRRTIHNCTVTDSNHKLSSITESLRFYNKEELIGRRLFANDYGDTMQEMTLNKLERPARRILTKTFTTILTTITTIFYFIHSAFTRVFTKMHRFSSWIMLLDTYLMRKNGGWRKRQLLVWLCLLPLLLLGAWWLLSTAGAVVLGALAPSVAPVAVGSDDVNKAVDMEEIVAKLLDNPSFLGVVNGNQDGVVAALRQEIDNVKLEMRVKDEKRAKDLDKLLADFRTQNDLNVARFSHQLRRCCRKPVINIDGYVARGLQAYLNDPEFLGHQQGLASWLHTVLLAKQDLEGRLEKATKNLDAKFEALLQENSRQIMDEIADKLGKQVASDKPVTTGLGTITDDQIRRIVRQTLAIYDADKTGLVDYAMEPMGGQVVSTRCTESYHSGKAVVSVLGIPLWYPVNTPRTVITPGVNPGECWAFENFPGFLIIKLSDRVQIEAFSMEHVNKLLVPNGKIDSAPKKFEVYGLREERDHDPIKLGEYVYDADGEPVQYFAVQQEGHIFDHIELRITSNHGNPNYTCLYRFRVHGKIGHETR